MIHYTSVSLKNITVPALFKYQISVVFLKEFLINMLISYIIHFKWHPQ